MSARSYSSFLNTNRKEEKKKGVLLLQLIGKFQVFFFTTKRFHCANYLGSGSIRQAKERKEYMKSKWNVAVHCLEQ